MRYPALTFEVLRYVFVLSGHTRAKNHATSCRLCWSAFATENTLTLQLIKVFNKPFNRSREGMRSKQYARTVAE